MDEQFFFLRVREILKEINMKMMARLVKLYEPYELTPPQVSILSILKNNKGIKVSELGTLMRTADSNISSICRRLEDRGFVTRERDETDRRVVYIQPTQKAKDLYDSLETEKEKVFAGLKDATAEDMVDILNALEKLHEMLLHD